MHRGLQRASSEQALAAVGFVALLCLAPIALFQWLRAELPPLTGSGMALFLTGGTLAGWLGSLISTVAIRAIGGPRTAMVRLMDPLFAFAFGYLFLQESLSLQTLGGMAAILVSLGLLTAEARRGDLQPETGAGWIHPGVAWAVLASLFFSLASICRKEGLAQVPSALISALTEAAAVVVIVSVGALLRGRWRETWSVLRATHWELWVAGLGAAAGTLFVNLALARIPVPVAVALRNTTPWFTFLLAPLLLERQFRASHMVWASSALLFGGMLMIVLRQ